MEILRNPVLDPALTDALVAIWVDVSNAGGAVGFVGPVTAGEVRPTAVAAFARVSAGTDDLVVAVDEGRPVGFGFLATNDLALHGHFATVKRLQRHPRARERGVGSAILAELEAAGRERALQRIVLTVRSGTGRERYYQALGYEIEAVVPNRIRLAEGDFRDEILLGKALHVAHDAPDARDRDALLVQRLDAGLPLPRYAHPGDAGLDLLARVDVSLQPGERAVVPTGIAVALPPGTVGLVHPRSGLAARHGLSLVNAPGTIDEGYRGEVQVIVVNLDRSEPAVLRRGDRIAQLVVQQVERPAIVEADDLPESRRGIGGFGSTGR